MIARHPCRSVQGWEGCGAWWSPLTGAVRIDPTQQGGRCRWPTASLRAFESGANRWFNLLWLLPIGFVGLIVAVAAAKGLRDTPSVQRFIVRYPGTLPATSASPKPGLPIWVGFGGYNQDHEFFGYRQSI